MRSIGLDIHAIFLFYSNLLCHYTQEIVNPDNILLVHINLLDCLMETILQLTSTSKPKSDSGYQFEFAHPLR